jgi:hypothetical protein
VELEGEPASTTGTTLSLRLGPVRELTAEALNSTAILVTWEEPMRNPVTTAPVTSYIVTYTSTDAGGGSLNPDASEVSMSLTLTGLAMGTSYTISVVGENLAGPGEPPREEAEASTDIDPPSVPRDFSGVSPNPFTITITWRAPATTGGRDIVRYDLTIAEEGREPETVSVLVREELSRRFEDLNQDANHTIAIVAVNRDEEGDGTERVSQPVETTVATLPVGPPQTPATPSASDITNTSVTVSWTDPGGYPDNYTLEIKRSIEDWTDDGVFRVPEIEGLSHFQDGLLPLTTYEARVLSFNLNGQSSFSALGEFVTVGSVRVGGGDEEVNGTLETTEGETVTLTCSLEQREGDSSAVAISWSRQDGRKLPQGSNQRDGVLTILEANVEDSGVYVCTARGLQGTFSLNINRRPSGEGAANLGLIIGVSVGGGLALLVFVAVVIVSVYCLCCRGEGKGDSPRRTYSFRPKHWTEASGSHSMLRQEPSRKDHTQSFHMPDEYTNTSSFNTTERVRHSPSPPSHTKSHAGAEPTTSFQLQSDNTVL